jgi:hypothetical protein
VADVVGCIKDTRELTSDEVGNKLDDVDGTKDTGEPILDELGNATDDMSDRELWLLIDTDTNAEVDSGEMTTLGITSGIWELDGTTVGTSKDCCEADTKVRVLADDEMTSDKDVDIDVGMELLVAAVWLIPLSSKLLVDGIWTDSASRLLVLSTGTKLGTDSRRVEDTIGIVETTRDDSTWRTLEVTSLLVGSVVGDTVVEIIWGSSEVGTTIDTPDTLSETVFGSSTVVDELNETLGIIVSEGVCRGGTSSLDRLRLDVALIRETVDSDDSEGDEATRDSVADRDGVKSVGRVVEVVLRSVWLASGSEDTAGVLISWIELTAVGSVPIADDPVMVVVGDGMVISEEGIISTLERVSGVVVIGDAVDASVSENELATVKTTSIIDVPARVAVGDEVITSEEGTIPTLDGVSRDAVSEDNVGGSVDRLVTESAEISVIAKADKVLLTLLGIMSIADVAVRMTVGDEMTMSEEDNASTLDTVSEEVMMGDNVDRSVGRMTSGPIEVSRLAEVDVVSPKLLADDISIEVGIGGPGSVIDDDVTTASEDVPRGVLMSTEAIWVAEAERSGLAVIVGMSSSLALDDAVKDNSEDEA